jgi:hypothetical protein
MHHEKALLLCSAFDNSAFLHLSSLPSFTLFCFYAIIQYVKCEVYADVHFSYTT